MGFSAETSQVKYLTLLRFESLFKTMPEKQLIAPSIGLLKVVGIIHLPISEKNFPQLHLVVKGE